MNDFDTMAEDPSFWASFFVPPALNSATHLRELLARLLGSDGKPAASGGEVTNGRHIDPLTHEPATNGLLDPAIFGPDGRRPGVIVLPEPVVHPAFRAELARQTDLTEEDIRAVARFDTCLEGDAVVSRERLARSEIDYDVIHENGGAKALRALLKKRGLADDGIIDHVVVIPPVERPLQPTDAGTNLPGPMGYALEDFLDALHDASIVADSVCSLKMEAWERVQDAFDALCATMSGTTESKIVLLDNPWLEAAARNWSEATNGIVGTPESVRNTLHSCLSPHLPSAPFGGTEADPLTPKACHFVGNDALVLKLPYALVCLELSSARLRWAIRSVDAGIMQVLPETYAALPHLFVVQRGDVLPSVHLLELDTGRWVMGWNDVKPPIFPMGPYKDNHWSIYDFGAMTARPMRQRGNWKGGAVLSPCLRYAWLDESRMIVRLLDEARQLEIEFLPRPARDSTGADEDTDDEFEDENDEDEDLDTLLDPRLTFVAMPHGFRVFHRGVLSDCAQEKVQLGDSYECACFNLHGTRLALGKAAEIIVYDLAENGEVLAEKSISLAPFINSLSLECIRARTTALTTEIESTLLCGFGTFEAIRSASRTELQDVVERISFNEVPADVIDEIFAALQASQP